MSRLIVHVGFPKCASTYLQKNVFPNFDNSVFITARAGFRGVVDPKESGGVFDPTLYEAIGKPNISGGVIREQKLADLKQTIQQDGRRFILSAEHFVMPGDCLLMDIEGSVDRNALDPDDIIANIKYIDENPIVVIIIRRQWTWLGSWYQERIKRYEARSFQAMLNSATFQNVLNVLDYDATIAKYEKAFGAENVKVLPFEALQHDAASFAQEICTIVQDRFQDKHQPVSKVGMSKPGVHMKRMLNKLALIIAQRTGGYSHQVEKYTQCTKAIMRYDGILRKAFGKYKLEKSDVDQSYIEGFEASNALLDKRLKLNLKSYGYYT